MRPVRIITAFAFAAAVAVTGCTTRSSADHPATAPAAPVAAAPTDPSASPAAKAAGSQSGANRSQPAVLVDGRHPVYLKIVDPSRRTITFDLVQWYQGADAAREAARDHQESPPPNDYYIRNSNRTLRTLPVPAAATITVNQIAGSNQNVAVTLARLATLTGPHSPMFWITVRHGQVVALSEQWVP